jgi:hypothetical protein
MTATKVNSLERQLMRVSHELHNAESATSYVENIRRFNRLNERYCKISGKSFDPTYRTPISQEMARFD